MDDASMDLTLTFPEDNVPPSDVPMEDCVVCGDAKKLSNMMTAPCGHAYCDGCVNELFDRAAKHEFNFPPKCCGRIITLEDAGLFLSWEIYKKFQEKFEEFSTADRTYCSDLDCATFIPPKTIENDKAKCPACQKLTCNTCKKEAHEGDCLEGSAVQPFWKTVPGFQQCSECKRMIERIEGCYHMTCICTAEFCYLCGLKWHTCNCDSVEWERMLNYAVANVKHLHGDGRVEWEDHVNLDEN